MSSIERAVKFGPEDQREVAGIRDPDRIWGVHVVDHVDDAARWMAFDMQTARVYHWGAHSCRLAATLSDFHGTRLSTTGEC